MSPLSARRKARFCCSHTKSKSPITKLQQAVKKRFLWLLAAICHHKLGKREGNDICTMVPWKIQVLLRESGYLRKSTQRFHDNNSLGEGRGGVEFVFDSSLSSLQARGPRERESHHSQGWSKKDDTLVRNGLASTPNVPLCPLLVEGSP